MHVCLYDENHKLVPPIEVIDEGESEMDKILRGTRSLFLANRDKAVNLMSDAEKNFDCSKCCRKFVHESGLYRHWDQHIGELLAPSPKEDMEVKKWVTLCKQCGEVFGVETDAFSHAMTYHFEVMDCLAQPSKKSGEATDPSAHKEEILVSCKGLYVTSNVHSNFKLISKMSGQTPSKSGHDKLQSPIFQALSVSSVYQCEFCESMFCNHNLMLLHVSQHDPSQGFSCARCEVTDMSIKDIMLHRRDDCVVLKDIRNPLRDFPRYWMCNVCNEEFQGIEQLVIHR